MTLVSYLSLLTQCVCVEIYDKTCLKVFQWKCIEFMC